MIHCKFLKCSFIIKMQNYFSTNSWSLICNISSCTRSLLILDDIWDSWVLKAFDNQCQVLITSRDRSVTDAVAGKEQFPLLHHRLCVYMYAICSCELLKESDTIYVYQLVHKWQSFRILLCETLCSLWNKCYMLSWRLYVYIKECNDSQPLLHRCC